MKDFWEKIINQLLILLFFGGAIAVYYALAKSIINIIKWLR